jgi:uridine kinase
VAVLDHVARRIPIPTNDECVRVGIDGPDASGKTFFADALAATLRERGRPVVRVSVDDFHHVRTKRYRLGRDSAEGFWLYAFDYDRLRRDVLDPLAPGGSRRYRPRAHDLATDAVLDPEPVTAPPGAVLVVDGLFLQRDELRAAFDVTVFLDVPFAVTARRMARRDGTGDDPDGPDLRRYVEAQRIYFAACDPHARATIVVDNTDHAAPRIRRADPEGPPADT